MLAVNQAGNNAITINMAVKRFLQQRFACFRGCDYGILYPGRLALLVQSPQGSFLSAYVTVARRLVLNSEQLERTISIEPRILEVWFPILPHVSNSSMIGKISGRVVVCSCHAGGH